MQRFYPIQQMKIFRRQPGLHFSAPLALTIGNFDGVHRGHQAILQHLNKKAQAEEMHTALMSFFPHPKTLVSGVIPPLLTPLRDRAYWLEQTGLGYWILQAFTQHLMHLAPERFIAEYLAPLQVKYLLIGDDFRFGYKGRGNIDLLLKVAPRYGFSVEALSSVVENGKRISSSLIRRALTAHNLAHARRLLGHELTFTGKVRFGAGRGKTLTVPTANLHLPENWCLPDGVYVVKIKPLQAGQSFWGVANIGTTPTFSGKRRKLEAHLFSAPQNLYGEILQVSVAYYLRGVKKFPDTNSLYRQIQQDIQDAKALINQENNLYGRL